MNLKCESEDPYERYRFFKSATSTMELQAMSSLWPKFSKRLFLTVDKWFRRPTFGDFLAIFLTTLVGLLSLALALFLISSMAIAMPLTAGDRLHIIVASGEEFSGRYQVDVQGRIQMPYTTPIMVAGLEPDAAAAAISDRLVSSGLFRLNFVRTSVSVVYWAPVQVSVSGAVFYPGAVRINLPIPRDRAPERQEEIPGGALPERRLSDALRAAGGVTPWADVSNVMVRRNGISVLHNLWGILRGENSLDPSLQSGDEVIVPTMPLPQAALARPSAITPPGVKIFMSNLITPAQSNNQATVSGGTISLPYGTRLSQAVIAGNCVGGIGSTAANRAAVLIRTDRILGTTSTLDAQVEDLIRVPIAENNPVLLEGDAVACYDSKVTNVRDVFRSLSDLLSPLSIILKGVRL
jgi:polysaccharide biosynthesis/export protein